MNSSYRGRSGVRIAAPKSNLIRAISDKRAKNAAAAEGKRREREREVAVDAPPLSSSDEEIESCHSSASERGRQGSGQQRNQRRSNLSSNAVRQKSCGSDDDNSDSSSCSQRGTKRRYPRDDEEEEAEEKKAPVRSLTKSYGSLHARSLRSHKATYGGHKTADTSTKQRSASATATTTTTTKSSLQKTEPVFRKYEDDVSDVSEPDEPVEPGKKPTKSTNSKTNAKDGKIRKRAARSPKSPTPPSTARFVKPLALTPERELSAEEAEQREATLPKKFQHSKWARNDEDDLEGQPKMETKSFRHSKWAHSDDESDATRSSNEKTKSKVVAAAKSTTNNTKAAQRSKDAKDDAKTDFQALLKSRQPWRRKLEKKKSGVKGSKGVKDGTCSRFGQLELEKEASPPPPRAVFRMPVFDSITGQGTDQDVYNVHDVEDAVQADADANADADADSTSIDTLACTGPVLCPLCKAPLDEDVLHDLLAGHPLLIGIAAGRTHLVQLNLLKFDEKLRFCAGHKQRAGRAAWTARGYPAIDWAALPARLPKYEAHVRKVILGTTPSPFRVTWESSSFSSSSLHAPGYYGRRGLRVLSDAIVQRHAKTLSRRAVEDRLLAARGMVQFVQAVLVPELAVLLIQEDLQAMGNGGSKRKRGSSLDEARRVLHESAALGEEVMEEERDVVEDEDESESEEEHEPAEHPDSEDSDASFA
ncbi:hypothetical protein SEPCBS57363_002373 [Sporothrix epigloea]|uniref:Restriction of telomere capping protein 4 n=1 Tax=Sporothrix epigloea TaxID=1892477 RepID=A0ABP0DFJ1_9PEZI